ncbi:MAG: hypothetical protein RI993_1566 [Pseudomonadota bacterium]|jgi:glycosyltransferase involved in cell wall biosynthesis
MNISLAIDASRNRSGGAIAHMIGLIGAAEPEQYGFSQVHVWSYDTLLDALPDRPWLVRHSPSVLERSILAQLWWQRYRLPEEITQAGCSIVFNTDAGTVSSFSPAVTISRNMLPFEPGEINRYSWSRAGLRLFLLRHIHGRSLRRAQGAAFLTRHAAEVIMQHIGQLPHVAIIPHGVGEEFRNVAQPTLQREAVRCLYVSNAAPYKHQWQVVHAIELLRSEGLEVTLELVGGGNGPAQARLQAQMQQSDPDGSFVTQTNFIPQSELPEKIHKADIFVFASSCENMPNTLVEGMASGLPIACSDRGPMPEILRDGGLYFDPEDSVSIAAAIRRLILNPDLALELAARSTSYAEAFSWKRCANETFSFIADTYRKATG